MGGADGCGTVFELSSQGIYSVLYNFCSQPNDADGAYPRGSLARDAKGNLYGVTSGGFGDYAGGTVFKLTP